MWSFPYPAVARGDAGSKYRKLQISTKPARILPPLPVSRSPAWSVGGAPRLLPGWPASGDSSRPPAAAQPAPRGPPRGPAPGPPLPSRLRGVRAPPPGARRCAPPDLRDSADSSTTHRPARRQIATVPTKAPGGSGMASGSQGGPTALRRPRPPAPPFRTAMTAPGGQVPSLRAGARIPGIPVRLGRAGLKQSARRFLIGHLLHGRVSKSPPGPPLPRWAARPSRRGQLLKTPGLAPTPQGRR